MWIVAYYFSISSKKGWLEQQGTRMYDKAERVHLHSFICSWDMVPQMQSGQPIPCMGIGIVSLQSQLKILFCCLILNLK